MTTAQIKDYLKKYRIDSEEQLAKHIEELKRNTIPNNEIIFPLVDLLLNEKSVLLSFFRENSKERGETAYIRTVTPFFLDEVLKYSRESLDYNKIKDIVATSNSTRHKAREEGRYHPYPLTSEKDDVITSSNRGEKEMMKVFENTNSLRDFSEVVGVKESQTAYKEIKGIKESNGKVDYSEINLEILDLMAERFTANKHKYPKGNMKKTIDIKSLEWALFRHVKKMIQPIETDEETYKDHLSAVLCNASMILDQLNGK